MFKIVNVKNGLHIFKNHKILFLKLKKNKKKFQIRFTLAFIYIKNKTKKF